jgi:guanylate kinase
MQPGQLIVITGPSGVGKGTLVRHLLTRFPNLYLSVSATTAPTSSRVKLRGRLLLSRPSQFRGENGSRRISRIGQIRGQLLWNTPISDRRSISNRQTVILEIELEGARQVCQSFPEARRIFILPPVSRN